MLFCKENLDNLRENLTFKIDIYQEHSERRGYTWEHFDIQF